MKEIKTFEQDLVIDPHLKMVAEFIDQNLPCAKMVAVANALPDLAKLLWGTRDWPHAEIKPLNLTRRLY